MPHSNPTPATAAFPIPTCLSVVAAARELGIGRTFVFALIKEGRLGSVKLGRRRVVPLAAIQDFLAQAQASPKSA